MQKVLNLSNLQTPIQVKPGGGNVAHLDSTAEFKMALDQEKQLQNLVAKLNLKINPNPGSSEIDIASALEGRSKLVPEKGIPTGTVIDNSLSEILIQDKKVDNLKQLNSLLPNISADKIVTPEVSEDKQLGANWQNSHKIKSDYSQLPLMGKRGEIVTLTKNYPINQENEALVATTYKIGADGGEQSQKLFDQNGFPLNTKVDRSISNSVIPKVESSYNGQKNINALPVQVKSQLAAQTQIAQNENRVLFDSEAALYAPGNRNWQQPAKAPINFFINPSKLQINSGPTPRLSSKNIFIKERKPFFVNNRSMPTQLEEIGQLNNNVELVTRNHKYVGLAPELHSSTLEKDNLSGQIEEVINRAQSEKTFIPSDNVDSANINSLFGRPNQINNSLVKSEGIHQVFDFGKIDNNNVSAIIDQITEYVTESRINAKPMVDFRFYHKSLGDINIHVENTKNDMIDLKIMTNSLQTQNFFEQHKGELLSDMVKSGLQVHEFTIDVGTNNSSLLGDGADKNFSQNSGQGGQKDFLFSGDRNNQQNSQRRRDLWQKFYNRESA